MFCNFFCLLQKKYRQQPSTFKHTSVTDSPDIIHAKLSGQITNEVRRCAGCLSAFHQPYTDFTCTCSVLQRLYKEKGVNDQHSYTITTERPEITQAKVNAANFSEVAPTYSALYFTAAVLYFMLGYFRVNDRWGFFDAGEIQGVLAHSEGSGLQTYHAGHPFPGCQELNRHRQ